MKCGSKSKFTKLSGTQLANTFASSLVDVADSLRDLYVQFGLRSYQVSIVRTAWTGGRRGIGIEYVKHELELLPTPKVNSFSSLTEILQPVGLDEVGSVGLSQISGRFTEDELLGKDKNGLPLGKDEQVFYEIHYPRSDGNPGVRRRFVVKGTPYYSASRLEWTVELERSHEDRSKDSALR